MGAEVQLERVPWLAVTAWERREKGESGKRSHGCHNIILNQHPVGGQVV